MVTHHGVLLCECDYRLGSNVGLRANSTKFHGNKFNYLYIYLLTSIDPMCMAFSQGILVLRVWLVGGMSVHFYYKFAYKLLVM